MADVFISYKREERPVVERLAHDLRRLGLDVWFDASLNAGESFSDEIDREARAAKAILVCWSPTARESKWVKAEALIGFEHGKLAACYVAGPNGFCPPTPFNAIHAEDLRVWVAAPSKTDDGYKSILRRIGGLCGRADIESYGALDEQAPPSVLRAWISAHGRSPLFMAVDELLRARDVEESERRQLEHEARQRRSREESDRLTLEERKRQEWADLDERASGSRSAHTRGALNAALERIREVRSTQRLPWTLVIGGVIGGLVVAALTIGIIFTAPRQQIWQADIQGREPEATTPDSVQTRADQSIPLPDMVRIPGRNLEVGRYEVTFAEWDMCVAAGGCGFSNSGFENLRGNDEGWGRGSRPVINVSEGDVREYLQWLSERTGRDYRLLTAEEWLYVARGGTTTTYYWGNDFPACDQRARNANLAACPDDRTQPVGSFPPNAYGVYDIYGNVWEWTSDCAASCTPPFAVVVVGGSWSSDFQQQGSRVSWVYHDGRGNDLGFRVARTL